MPDRAPSAWNEDDDAHRREHEGRQPESPTAERVEEEIHDEIIALHRESYGGGAASTKVYLLEDLVVVLLEGLELQPSEAYLIEKGHREAVVNVRDQFQQAIGPSFVAIVERATGRRVNGFTSHLQVAEEPYAIEAFRLDARAD